MKKSRKIPQSSSGKHNKWPGEHFLSRRGYLCSGKRHVQNKGLPRQIIHDSTEPVHFYAGKNY